MFFYYLEREDFEDLGSILERLTDYQLKNGTFEYEKETIIYQKGTDKYSSIHISKLNFYDLYDLNYIVVNSFTGISI